MVINPLVGVYIPIIRIPIKGGMTIPNIATFDHGTYKHTKSFGIRNFGRGAGRNISPKKCACVCFFLIGVFFLLADFNKVSGGRIFVENNLLLAFL